MKTLNALLAAAAFAATPALAQMHSHGSDAKGAAPGQAQMPMHGAGAGHAMPGQAMPMGGAMMSDAEVRKIDKDAGKITLRHGPIRNLDMPPMTMVFQVGERAMLDKVKVGEKVRFAAEDKGGALTVTAIEAAK